MAAILPKGSTEIIGVELQGFCAYYVLKSSNTFFNFAFFLYLKFVYLCSQSFSKYVKDVKRVSAKADKR